jgi:hypothetical protein
MIARVPAGLLAMLALVVAACDGGGGAVEHPTGAGELVLRSATGGGLVPPGTVLRAVPEFSLLGDGRIIVPGPQMEIYPGPALPNLLQRSATEDGVQAILRAADEVGLLGPDRTLDAPGIMDAPTTIFTAVANGSRHVTSVYALGLDVPTPPGVSEEELEARKALAAFQASLFNLDGWLPKGSLGEEAPYTFDELRVYVEPYALSPEPELQQAEKPWPLAEPLASFGERYDQFPDVRCGAVHGEDLARLLPEAQGSNELTPWTSGGERYHLVFRPLLPDEHGC